MGRLGKFSGGLSIGKLKREQNEKAALLDEKNNNETLQENGVWGLVL